MIDSYKIRKEKELERKFFSETELGRAFDRFEKAVIGLWSPDARRHSTKRLIEIETEEREARLDLIRQIMEIENVK